MKESENNQYVFQHMEHNNFTSEAIDLVRFPLAIMVVFIHSVIRPEETLLMPTDYAHLSGMDVYNIVRSFGSHVFSHIAVPTFFLISGYLFFKRLEIWDWSIWKQKMYRRIHTLVIPYFIWCVLFVLWKPNIWESYIRIPIYKLGAVIFKGKPLHGIIDYWNTLEPLDIDWPHVLWDSQEWGGTDLNWLGNYVVHNTSPELFPFWFMRNLIVVVVLTPLVYWIVKKLGPWFIGFMGLLYVSGIWPDIHGLSSSTLFYFSIGSWFTLNGRDLCSTLYSYRWFIYLPYLILLPLMVYLDGVQTYGGKSMYIIIGVMTALCFSYYLVKEKGIRKHHLLVGSCFFVFAFHVFINGDIYHYVNRMVGDSSA